MNIAFDTTTNDFLRKYLIKGQREPSREEVMLYPMLFEKQIMSIFETLLIRDAINIKIVGENIPLAILINKLGVQSLEQLIEQQGIKFTHWTPNIFHFVDNISGVIPIMAGRHNSDVHCDPEASIAAGIKFLINKPDKRTRSLLVRKIRDLYEYPSEGIEHNAVDMVMSAYNSNKLKDLGIDNKLLDIYNLPAQSKQKLSKCAQNILEYKYLAEKKLITTDGLDAQSIFLDSSKNLLKSNHSAAFSKIIELENFPKIDLIYQNLENPLRKVIKLRETRNAKKFREWLHTAASSEDIEGIARIYTEALVRKSGFWESNKGRLTKIAVMATAGAAVGSIATPIGSYVGGSIGAAIPTVLDLGLDLVDEYFLSGLCQGWTPRMFIDEIRAAKIRIPPKI